MKPAYGISFSSKAAPRISKTSGDIINSKLYNKIKVFSVLRLTFRWKRLREEEQSKFYKHFDFMQRNWHQTVAKRKPTQK